MMGNVNDKDEEKAPKAGPFSSLFVIVTALNGWSLVVVGLISLIISAFAGALAGVWVSLAVVVHGALELVYRKKALSHSLTRLVKKMALNQLGLATSLSLYFAYQVLTIDGDALQAMTLKAPLYDLLQLYPEALRLRLIELLPRLVVFLYGVAALTSWLFCGLTAFYYHRQAIRPRGSEAAPNQ